MPQYRPRPKTLKPQPLSGYPAGMGVKPSKPRKPKPGIRKPQGIRGF